MKGIDVRRLTTHAQLDSFAKAISYEWSRPHRNVDEKRVELIKHVSETQKYLMGSCESYIEGPRWMISEGWITKTVWDLNSVFERKGWKPIVVEYERSTTTLFRRTIFFRLSGQQYPLEMFMTWLHEALREHNAA